MIRSCAGFELNHLIELIDCNLLSCHMAQRHHRAFLGVKKNEYDTYKAADQERREWENHHAVAQTEASNMCQKGHEHYIKGMPSLVHEEFAIATGKILSAYKRCALVLEKFIHDELLTRSIEMDARSDFLKKYTSNGTSAYHTPERNISYASRIEKLKETSANYYTPLNNLHSAAS